MYVPNFPAETRNCGTMIECPFHRPLNWWSLMYIFKFSVFVLIHFFVFFIFFFRGSHKAYGTGCSRISLPPPWILEGAPPLLFFFREPFSPHATPFAHSQSLSVAVFVTPMKTPLNRMENGGRLLGTIRYSLKKSIDFSVLN